MSKPGKNARPSRTVRLAEFERVCSEHAPFLLACLYIMNNTIRNERESANRQYNMRRKDTDVLLTRIDELENALRRAGGAD